MIHFFLFASAVFGATKEEQCDCIGKPSKGDIYGTVCAAWDAFYGFCKDPTMEDSWLCDEDGYWCWVRGKKCENAVYDEDYGAYYARCADGAKNEQHAKDLAEAFEHMQDEDYGSECKNWDAGTEWCENDPYIIYGDWYDPGQTDFCNPDFKWCDIDAKECCPGGDCPEGVDFMWEIKDCSFDLPKECDCIDYDWNIIGGGRIEFEKGSTCAHKNKDDEPCLWWFDGCTSYHCKHGKPDYEAGDDDALDLAKLDPDCKPSEKRQMCYHYDDGSRLDHQHCRLHVHSRAEFPGGPDEDHPECPISEITLQCIYQDKLANMKIRETHCLPDHACEHVIKNELGRLGYECKRIGDNPCVGVQEELCETKEYSKQGCALKKTDAGKVCVYAKGPEKWNKDTHNKVCAHQEDMARCKALGCRVNNNKCRANKKKVKCKDLSTEFCQKYDGCSLVKNGKCKGSHKW